MFSEIKKIHKNFDWIIKAAAVADYTPKTVASSKIKKSDGDMKIELERTDDILAYLGQNKQEGQIICGFSMETDNVLENSRKKLSSKNCDLICANSINRENGGKTGFKSDTNALTIITPNGEFETGIVTKEQAAHKIFDIMKTIKK